MKNTNKKTFLWFVALFCAISMVGCSDSGDEGGGSTTGSFKLTSYYPQKGKYLEKVILKGQNFSSDVSKIKAYFNQRPAAVIGVDNTGTEMYVLAPRLPGDDCVISVVIGNDSLTYPETFAYTASMTVTTIVGNGTKNNYANGPLSEAEVSPYYVCVDKEDNIFVCSRNGDVGENTIARIDEEADEMVAIVTGITGNVPCVAPDTQIVTMPTETTIGSFVTMDPREMWAPRYRTMKWPTVPADVTNGYKHCMVVNPADGYIYCRFYFGQVVRIDPKTFETVHIAITPLGDSYGLSFNPLHPNILYLTLDSNAKAYNDPVKGDQGTANSICCVDVSVYQTTLDAGGTVAEAIEACGATYERLSSPQTGGHRDGKLEDAQFLRPFQMFSDNDGNMYIADCDNQCIRRMIIDKDDYRTGTVETVLGMPGTSGWKDGTKDDALFKYPRGIGISEDGTVFVADYGNARIRKLSIN